MQILLAVANNNDNYTNTTKDIHTTNWEYYFDPSIFVYLYTILLLSSILRYSLHFIITHYSDDRLEKSVISSDQKSKIMRNHSRRLVIAHPNSTHNSPILDRNRLNNSFHQSNTSKKETLQLYSPLADGLCQQQLLSCSMFLFRSSSSYQIFAMGST